MADDLSHRLQGDGDLSSPPGSSQVSPRPAAATEGATYTGLEGGSQLPRKEATVSPETAHCSPTSRLSSARATPEGKSMTSGSESERANERMARYKEERRRQLAARTAHLRHSSSDEDDARAPGGSRPKLRRRRGSREARVRSSAEEAAEEAGGGVRMTRASRLRAAAQGHAAGRAAGLGASCTSPDPTTGGDHSAAASGRSDDDGRTISGRRDRDKSSRRKSNLNRALGVEQTSDPAQGESPASVGPAGCDPADPAPAGRRAPPGSVRPPRAPTPELSRPGRPALRRTLDAGTNFIQRRPDGAASAGSERPDFLRLNRREVADTGVLRRPHAVSGRTRSDPTTAAPSSAPELERRQRRGRTESDRTATARAETAPGQVARNGQTVTTNRSSDLPRTASTGENTVPAGTSETNGESTSARPDCWQRGSAGQRAASSTDRSKHCPGDHVKKPSDWLPLDDKLKLLTERDAGAKTSPPPRSARAVPKVNTDDISARIEKLTSLARATAVRVDRLTGPSTGTETSSLQSAGSGSDSQESSARRLASEFESGSVVNSGRSVSRESDDIFKGNSAMDESKEYVTPTRVESLSKSVSPATENNPSVAPSKLMGAKLPYGADDKCSDIVLRSGTSKSPVKTVPTAPPNSSPVFHVSTHSDKASKTSMETPCEKRPSSLFRTAAASGSAESAAVPSADRSAEAESGGSGAASDVLRLCEDYLAVSQTSTGVVSSETPAHQNGAASRRGSSTADSKLPSSAAAPTDNGVSRLVSRLTSPVKMVPPRSTQIIEEVVIVRGSSKKPTGVAALRQALENKAAGTAKPPVKTNNENEPLLSERGSSRTESLASGRAPLWSPGPSPAAESAAALSSSPSPAVSPAFAPGLHSPPMRSASPVRSASAPRSTPGTPSLPRPARVADSGDSSADDAPLPRRNSLGSTAAPLSPKPTSILKQRKQSQPEDRPVSRGSSGGGERSFSPELRTGGPRPILKKKQRSSPEESEPRPILKKRSSTDDELEVDRPPRPILKNRSVEDVTGAADDDLSPVGLRPILKSSRSREEELDASPEPPQSILKRRSLDGDADSRAGILRRDSGGDTDRRRAGGILRRRRSTRDATDSSGEAEPEEAPQPTPRPASVAFAEVSTPEAVNRVLVTSSPSSPPPPSPPPRCPASEDPTTPETDTSTEPVTPEREASAEPATPAPMTLAQKQQLFLQFEARSRQKTPASRPVRLQRGGRQRAQRSQTQPITPDEVAAAAALPTSRRQPAAAAAAAAAPAVVPVDAYLAAAAAVGAVRGPADGCGPAACVTNTPAPRQRRRSMDEETPPPPPPEGQQLSVAERARQYQQAMAAARSPLPPPTAPPTGRRRLRHRGLRFQTQPVTPDEVREAHGSSARWQPPDSHHRALDGLSLRESRRAEETAAGRPPTPQRAPSLDGRGTVRPEYAGVVFSELPTSTRKPPRRTLRTSSPEDVSRGILRPSSRSGSPEERGRGILKPSSRSGSPAEEAPGRRSSLKPASRASSPEERGRGILKPPSRASSPEEPRADERGRGILKPASRASSPEEPRADERGRGILKPPSRAASPEEPRADERGRGILKPPSRASSPEEVRARKSSLRPSSRPSSPELRLRGSILRPSSRATSPEDHGRSILKPPSRPSSPELELFRSRGILKPPSRPTSPEDKGRGILKPPSRPTSPEERSRSILKPPSRPSSPDEPARGILRSASRPTSPDGGGSGQRVTSPRCGSASTSGSDDEAYRGSLADQLLRLDPRHNPSQSDPGKTVEQIAADITRRSRPSVSRRQRCPPAGSAMVLQKTEVPSTGEPETADLQLPPEIRRTGGIKDRLAALQKNGDEAWRRRVRPEEPRQELVQALNTSLQTSAVLRRKVQATVTTPQRPVSHIEMVSGVLQQSASESWKSRVPDNDANRFTVAGKMGQPMSPGASPLLARRHHNTPKAEVFRSKHARRDVQSMYVESTSATAERLRATHRQNSQPADGIARPASVIVSVPELADASFSAFFSAPLSAEELVAPLDWSELDLDAVSRQAAPPRAAAAARERVRRPAARTGRNPLRALSARRDLLTEYEEVRLGVGEKMVKMMKVEEMSRRSTLAQEALAGLAAKVDFSAVKLAGSKRPMSAMPPYLSSPMLLRVKGRRHVQTRLVPPHAGSLNHGDCFVLVANDQVVLWSGRFSNVIEQSKAADVAAHVARYRDLGCRADAVDAVEHDAGGVSSGRRHEAKLFQLLGGRQEVPEAGSPDEDERYEAAVVATNKVYSVSADEELVPVEQAWGQLPKYELLQPDKVFVFDFGAEVYVWTGKLAGRHLRDAGKRLAGDLWEAGCDYSGCDVSPVEGATEAGPRPDWGILGRVGQNMETILFREKFLDWKDSTRLIKVRSDSDSESTELAPPLELAPCDAGTLLQMHHPQPDLVLEMEHLGRGQYYYDQEARRQLEISTMEVVSWHVTESASRQLPHSANGQLFDGDTYVVRWMYQVTQTGRRLGGGASKHLCVGRQRCAYFFWQGACSSVNEKGASALMVMELDRERGPQVRVTQGREPAAFLQLFSGRLIIHRGRRDHAAPADWRLFVVRGQLPAEASLLEVTCSAGSLRSRAAFVAVHAASRRAFLWSGAGLCDEARAVTAAAARLLEKPPTELGTDGEQLTVTELREGSENRQFWNALGGEPSPLPPQLQQAAASTPRLFHFSCGSGRFTASLVPCLHCGGGDDDGAAYPLPYSQQELYSRPQPALLLLDAGHTVYVWQGWRPPADQPHGTGEALAGAAAYRWQEERRCALQTAVEYSQLRGRLPCRLVVAGVEPAHFQHLFPAWTTHEEAARLNTEEGFGAGFERVAADVLAELSRSTYPLHVLMERPLPDGVNPVRLERYLSDAQFTEVLAMERSAFDALPAWKQTQLKKDAGLF